jgi:hypothetical protein
MDTYVNLITNVGFPIACVLALSYFIYKSWNDLNTKYTEREDKLYTMLSNAQTSIDAALETNGKFLAQLEVMQENLSDISTDVDDIKDYLQLNKRADD